MTDNGTPDELNALADRVDAGSGISNSLDAEIEIAMFIPSNGVFVSVHRNAATTKLVYTRENGSEMTCWPMDWTMDRPRTAAALRARALDGQPK